MRRVEGLYEVARMYSVVAFDSALLLRGRQADLKARACVDELVGSGKKVFAFGETAARGSRLLETLAKKRLPLDGAVTTGDLAVKQGRLPGGRALPLSFVQLGSPRDAASELGLSTTEDWEAADFFLSDVDEMKGAEDLLQLGAEAAESGRLRPSAAAS